MKSSKKSLTANTTKNLYDGKVVYEALNRAGANPHIKGHIHEILFKDQYNTNLKNILNGTKAEIVKNPNAKVVDIIIRKGDKVVQRLQLKDTPGSIGKVVKEIKNGHYQSAQVLMTKETCEKTASKLAEEGIKKPVQSSGISTSRTTELAAKSGSTAGGVANSLKCAAKNGGMWGGAVSGGISAVKGIDSLFSGEKDLGEVAKEVAKDTAGGVVSGAAGAAAGAGAGLALTSAISGTMLAGTALATVSVVAAPIAVAVGVGWVASELWDAFWL